MTTTKTWESWVCNLEPLVAKAAELGIKPNWHHLDRMRAELERDIGEHDDEPYIDSAHARRVEERQRWKDSPSGRIYAFTDRTYAEAAKALIEKQESPSHDGLAMTERAQG